MQLHIWLSNEGHCPCGFHFYSFYMKIGQVYINAKKRVFTGGEFRVRFGKGKVSKFEGCYVLFLAFYFLDNRQCHRSVF